MMWFARRLSVKKKNLGELGCGNHLKDSNICVQHWIMNSYRGCDYSTQKRNRLAVLGSVSMLRKTVLCTPESTQTKNDSRGISFLWKPRTATHISKTTNKHEAKKLGWFMWTLLLAKHFHSDSRRTTTTQKTDFEIIACFLCDFCANSLLN